MQKKFFTKNTGKTLLRGLACFMLLVLSRPIKSLAQVTFTSGALTQSEDFSSLGTVQVATLPGGWRWQESATPVFLSGSTSTQQRGGTSGTLAQGLLFTSSAGGTYNFANGVNTTSTERALGFLGSGSVAARSIMVEYLNSTGLTLTDATVSFDYEKYRSGTRAFDWTFFYSTDGTTWTALPAGNQSYAGDANNTTVLNPPAPTSKTAISITGLNVTDGNKFYLRWHYAGNGGSSNAQALGIDNVSVTATVSAGTCTAPAQVTSFTAPSVTASSINLAWSSPANNVLIVRRKGSAPTSAPFGGMTYTAGAEIGTAGSGDTIAYVGSASAATINNLVPNAQYFFKSYAFDPTGFTGNTPCYNGTNPVAMNATTASCLSAQVTGFSASNIQGTFTDLAMTVPATAQVLILQKAGTVAISDAPAQGTAYTIGGNVGASTVAYIGNASTATITGLSTGTQYQFAAFAYDPAGYNNNPCYVTPATTISITTTPCNSVAQITSFNAGTPNSFSIPLSWNLAAGEILVLKRKAGAVTGAPVNGTSYTVGGVIGTQDTVAYVGSANSFTATNLTPNSAYYFRAFAFDPTGFTGNTPCYNTTNAPSAGPATTLNCTGGQQITGLASQNVQGTNLSLAWNLPTGTSVVILQKTGAAVIPANAYPVSGNAYAAGDVTGTGVTVAYAGNMTGAAITALATGTAYHYEAFAYDPTGYNSQPCYNLSTPVAINVTTSPCDGGQPISSITASNATSSTLELNWGAPTNQVLILQSAGGANSNVPTNGTTYTVGDMVSNEKVVYVGSGNNISLTNLLPGTPYNYKAFAFDPSGYTGGTPCYNWLNAPTTSISTTACVNSQVSAFTAANQTATSVDLAYTVPTGASVIVMMRAGTPIQGDFPQVGTLYTTNQIVGNNTVAYIGNSNAVTIGGLNPSTAYHFAVFAFNPTGYTGNTPCYLTSNFPVANKTTNACATPTIAPTNLTFTPISNNSFAASWTNGNGGKRIVAVNTVNTFTAPIDGTDPVANSSYAGTGQQIVYNGSSNTATITNLSPNTTYYFAVYEGSCTGTAVLFNSSSLTGNHSIVTASITTGLLAGNAFCAGFPVSIPFTITGSYNAGNIFTAQLSDHLGSFVNPVTVGTLASELAGTIHGYIPGNAVAGTAYRMRVISDNPSIAGTDNGSDFSINAAASGNATTTQTIAGSTDFADQCNAISNITPSGAAPVSGTVTSAVTVDPAVSSYNGQPYVQRHHDIAPATNANTATASVTLYYHQSDFDNYNAANGAMPDLPASPTDTAGKSNLKIMQYHGTSTTGLPGSYTGWTGSGPDHLLITPSLTTWNDIALRWEVSFPVTGFSGFFAMGITGAPLPIKLKSFTARADGAYRNRLDWIASTETAGISFIAERSENGAGFGPLGTSTTGNHKDGTYTFYDEQPLQGISYYRLKMIEKNGDISYSNVVVVRTAGIGRQGSFTIAPVPAKDQLTLTNTDVSLDGSPAHIVDMQGREVYRFNISKVTAINTTAWAPGIYILHLASGEKIRVSKQ